MLAPFMEVLDTSVANVALPHIGGNLSATPEEATWVLTSYLVSNAIILPMTGWLGNYFGRRRLFLLCVVLFTFASVLCGMATSLGLVEFTRQHRQPHGRNGSDPASARRLGAQKIVKPSFHIHITIA